jgi:signal transduction histidine kinase
MGLGNLIVASQGRTVVAFGYQNMEEVARAPLPESSDHWSLGSWAGSSDAYAFDGSALWVLRLKPVHGSWALMADVVLPSTSDGIEVAILRDRLIALTGSDVVEVLSQEEVTSHALGDTIVATDAVDAFCASRHLVCVGHNDRGCGYLTLLSETPGGWRKQGTIVTPGEVFATATLTDTTLVAGGMLVRGDRDTVGWIAIFDGFGAEVCRTEHPRPVAILSKMDDYVVAHGRYSNLSVYGPELRPMWDHASYVQPVALLTHDFDGIGSTDVAVIGIVEHNRPKWQVDSLRVLLEQPDIFEGAELIVRGEGHSRQERYLKQEGSAALFLSRRNELKSTLEMGQDRAQRLLAAGDANEALRFATDARGAAAALGDRDSVAELTSIVARCVSLPERTQQALVAAIVLLVLGAYAGIRRWQGAHRMEVSALWTMVLFLVGGIAWWIVGSTKLSWSLPAGGVVVAAVTLVATVRARKPYTRVVAGSLIEELIEELAAFIHGGLKDSLTRDQGESRPDQGDYARKNITKLAYLAQEMQDSLGDRRRFEKLMGMLQESAQVYRRSVFPRTRILTELGHKTRFMVESLDALAGAASEILAALGVILGDEAADDEALRRDLKSIQDGRQRLVNAAEKVRDAVESNPGCSLSSSIADVLSTARESLETQAVAVEHNSRVARGRDAVRIKRPELFTILENLLTNASKAMRESRTRRLTIIVRGNDDACTVAVEDTGRGMSPEEMGEVFVERTDQSAGRFGLPYTRRTLRRYGGEIAVASTVGKGTTFVISIPRWRPETEEEEHEQEGQREGKAATCR